MFRKQADAIEKQLDSNPVENMPVYRAGDWHTELTAILRKHFTKAALLGAELELAASPIKSKDFKGVTDRLRGIVKASVDKAVAKATKIIHGINETTGKIIEGVVSTARQAGDTAKEIAGKVRDILTGDSGNKRATDIARGETTAGLTVGQESQRQEWVEDGYTNLTKTWSAVDDDKTRETHSEADGQTVPVGEYFTVGGHECSGPGDPSLPGEERANCRCWSTTGTA